MKKIYLDPGGGARLCDSLHEIVTVSAHKYNVIIRRHGVS